jgi:hypothetical protein
MYTSRLFASGILMGTLALTACGGVNTATTVRGSGIVKTEARAVHNFREVALSGVGTIIVRQGTIEGLRIEAEDNIIPHISATVSQDRLTIGTREPNVTLSATQPIVYYVSAKQISALHLYGSGEIHAPNLRSGALDVRIFGAGNVVTTGLRATALTVAIAGTGNYTGDGIADSQHVNLAGSGNYLAKQLRGDSADVSIAGIGSATVCVGKRLSAEITGAGTVLYIGSPEVQQRITGVGTVTQTT